MRLKFMGLCMVATALLSACGTQSGGTADPATPADSGTIQSLAAKEQPTEQVDAPLPATDAESGWEATYEGTVGGKSKATLAFHGLGDYVRGSITYQKTGQPIIVLGKFLTDGTFFLRELGKDGNVSGVLSGSENGGKLSGTWYAPGTDRELELAMDAVAVKEEGTVPWPYAATSISGSYGYHYGKEGPQGTISVTKTGETYSLAIDCVTGAPGYNQASVEAAGLRLDGHTLRHKVPGMDCEVSVEFFDGFAFVGFVDEQTDCGFGHNATVEGEYLKLQ